MTDVQTGYPYRHDGVVVRKVFDLRDWSGLIELVMRLAGDLLRHQFGHALDVNVSAGFACTLGDRVRHRLDVAVSGIVENQNFRHVGFLDGFVTGRADTLTGHRPTRARNRRVL